MKPILYVEDEPDDIFFMRRAFEKAGIEQPLQTVPDGEQAIAYLAGRGQYSDRRLFPLPGVVLLDLNMPHTTGFEVLKWIRATPAVCSLPVLVLTSSNHESDLQRASILGANGFLVKPSDPESLLEMLQAFKAYWLMHDRLVGRMMGG